MNSANYWVIKLWIIPCTTWTTLTFIRQR